MCVCFLSFLISVPVFAYLDFPHLTRAKRIALVSSTSSLHHFLFLLVVIVLSGKEGIWDGERGEEGGGGSAGGVSLFNYQPHLPNPPPDRLDPHTPGRASQTTRWLSVSCFTD